MNHNLRIRQIEEVNNNTVIDAIKRSYGDILVQEYVNTNNFVVQLLDIVNMVKTLLCDFFVEFKNKEQIEQNQKNMFVRISEIERTANYYNFTSNALKPILQHYTVYPKSIIIYIMLYLYTQVDETKKYMICSEQFAKKYLASHYPGLELTEDQLQRYVNFSNHLFVLKHFFEDRFISLFLDVLSRFEHPWEYIRYVTGSGQKIIVTIRTELIDKIFEYVKIKRKIASSNNNRKRSKSIDNTIVNYQPEIKTTGRSIGGPNIQPIINEIKETRPVGRPSKLSKLESELNNINNMAYVSSTKTSHKTGNFELDAKIEEKKEISTYNAKLNQYSYIDIDGNYVNCDIETLDGFDIDMSLFDR